MCPTKKFLLAADSAAILTGANLPDLARAQSAGGSASGGASGTGSSIGGNGAGSGNLGNNLGTISPRTNPTGLPPGSPGSGTLGSKVDGAVNGSNRLPGITPDPSATGSGTPVPELARPRSSGAEIGGTAGASGRGAVEIPPR